MAEVAVSKDAVLSRISGIVDSLLQSEKLFQEKLNKDELMQIFSHLLEEVSPEELLSLEDEQLTKRVDGVMMVEATSGMLNDLTPEQMEMFDAAVEGR
ncbi:hypothetical protein [Kamptonema formosum]|jgi:hypothetical protein|uniref:hypothetical protein n=1 Tax=Kamptonema formosum TaxID=331992 RepID=UPI00034D0EBF|nr:hypothetical protein [Oscillatoria sp. PCC 10802]MBW4492416.1 hypothetical protein [Oscillatoria princeps RMCB-10]